MRKRVLLGIVVGLSAVVAVAVTFWFVSDLPPAPFVQVSSEAYNETNVQSKTAKLVLLAEEYGRAQNIEQQKDCVAAVDAVIGDTASPEDLALLAIWAEQQQPWLTSSCVYRSIFFGDIQKLAAMRGNQRAAYAIWKIRESLVHEHRWDGHLSEVVQEAQRKQQLRE
jgi:hypothetical protein